jgi:serine/threonine protein kinase/tetratricopeptide (TPR) repeat protein
VQQPNDTGDPTMILGLVGGPGQAAPGSLYAGRYRVEKMVGRGGMGVVFRAVDVIVGDTVALKVLDADVARSPQHLEWFRREVRLARRISHPNVARTHDIGEQAGTHYITMEFVEGHTLDDLLRVRGDDGESHLRAIDPVRAARVALAVADGLTAAHAAGVVHRDLKPANILIEHAGRVAITDFGIARGIADEAGRTQGMVGTPLYMAPEQVCGQPVDYRTDLYTLGLILFEMLTGRSAFVGDTPLIAALKRLESPAPDPRTLDPELPEPLARLTLHCLAEPSSKRPASAVEVADALRAWLQTGGHPSTGGLSGPAPSAAPSSTPSPPRSATAASLHPTAARHSTSTPPHPSRVHPSGNRLAPANERALAVLPLRYQGPPATSYLGDAVTDEIIDVLSRTRGLKVLGSGATARFRDNRDPRAVGAELGVDAVVDATLQCTPTAVRVLARLVEVETGLQLWNDRIEVRADDLFEVQDRVSKRIAEALRVELTTAAHRGDANPEAVALYLRARRKLYAGHILGADGAIDLLEACLALAPEFRPAIASHAVACVRAWFLARSVTGELTQRDLPGDARRSVARALEVAPEIADTHLARGMLAVQTGEWRHVVQSLVKALDIAPTYPHALQFLAQLQCEAGNTREGVARALLAADLEPALMLGYLDVARVHALRGEFADYEQALARISESPTYRFPILQLRMRVATWNGDLETPRRILTDIHGDLLHGYHQILIGYAKSVLAMVTKEEMDAFIAGLLATNLSPRMDSVICQLCSEIFCIRGYPDDALKFFKRAAEGVLTDIEWVDRCPLLTPMRELPGYDHTRRKVRARVDAMWIV